MPRYAWLAAPATVALFICCLSAIAQDEPRYGIGSWPETGHGNHRALVRVAAPAEAVWAHIKWRRRDTEPEKKAVLVFDAATGKQIANVVRVSITREAGDIVFQPATAPGTYEVYYLPYNPGTGNFDDPGTYFPPQDTAAADWIARNKLDAEGLARGDWKALPKAEITDIQARNEFNRMDPMEVIATPAERDALLAKHPGRDYLLFPEDRRYPIRMFEDLPLKWIGDGARASFAGEAQPGEYYPFQIGIWAARKDVRDLKLTFTDLTNGQGDAIKASMITCFNLGGVDWLGRPFTSVFDVATGRVRPLWIGLQVPPRATGTYEGLVHVKPAGEDESVIGVSLRVNGPVLSDAGDSELWRMSRLRWLNSTLGLDDEVLPPYKPVKVDGSTLRILGRAITYNSLGLPSSIVSNNREILASPVKLAVEASGASLNWKAGATKLLKQAPGTVVRETVSASGALTMTVRSQTECDGCISYWATLKAARPMAIRDVRLEVPIRREVAPYMMGMSKRGGYRPKEWKWAWDITRADNMVWIGDVDAGLQTKLVGPKDVWQYDLKVTGIPPSWGNGGKGGATIAEVGNAVLLRAFSGDRALQAGEELQFRFRFLVTPFRPIDPNHWNWRYGDTNRDANILHIHHATPENPYINYPFLKVDQLRQTVQSVKAIHTKTTDPGQLMYPAAGNIDPDRGSLHIWARVDFDPEKTVPGRSQDNQELFDLQFPNQDELGFYWNTDDHGMRVYVRRGAPSQNQYPVLFGTRSDGWKRGDRHLLTLSWGDRLAVFVDGKLLGSAAFQGTLKESLEKAALILHGGFALSGIKITNEPFVESSPVTPTADTHTLLLDTFANWDGGKRTKPEKIAAGGSGIAARGCGAVEGTIQKASAPTGKEMVFSAKVIETGPKGVNIYYTVRELSNRVAEMWALRSLEDEIFATTGEHFIYSVEKAEMSGTGGGNPWLKEHLVNGYIPAWRQPLFDGETDAAISTQGLSRWHNYYVEGMGWLMRNTGVDGLYLDGIGYDREIMKRIAKVMYRTDPKSRRNFHSGNDYDFLDHRISPANEYMEHFPYLSNLWFGEMYDYDRSPDYWLVEISGIPFGLTSEMLNYENGGNAYRGMVYGMTGRLHPSASAMWRFWDEFGIQDAQMIGYWSPSCPVKTNRPDVLATVYKKKGEALIALGHWPQQSPRTQAVTRLADTAPIIDGKIDAEEWDRAARLTNFTAMGQSGMAASQRTEAFVTADQQNLYVAFRCAQAGQPKAAAVDSKGAVWDDDAVEVFIQPDPDKGAYFQFVGNSKGVFMSTIGPGAMWEGPWVYRTSSGDGEWSGELSIPLSALGMKPLAERQVIGFNICRDQQTPTHELSSWSPVSQTFHDPSHFGLVTFSSTQPATREEPGHKAEQQALKVKLEIDWAALGLNPKTVTLTAPAIGNFQSPAQFGPEDEIPIQPAKGWLLVAR